MWARDEYGAGSTSNGQSGPATTRISNEIAPIAARVVNIKALLRRVIPAGTRVKLRQAQRALIENFPRGYRAVGLVAQTPEFWEADGRYEFLRRAFRTATFNGISGDYVEFGRSLLKRATAIPRCPDLQRCRLDDISCLRSHVQERR
jgi:hypothetical protein